MEKRLGDPGARCISICANHGNVTVSKVSGITSQTRFRATAAAIDRVVHHSIILEFDVPSYRTHAAQHQGQEEEVDRQNRLTPDRQECLTRDTR
jgi:hypothetical protein